MKHLIVLLNIVNAFITNAQAAWTAKVEAEKDADKKAALLGMKPRWVHLNRSYTYEPNTKPVTLAFMFASATNGKGDLAKTIEQGVKDGSLFDQVYVDKETRTIKLGAVTTLPEDPNRPTRYRKGSKPLPSYKG